MAAGVPPPSCRVVLTAASGDYLCQLHASMRDGMWVEKAQCAETGAAEYRSGRSTNQREINARRRQREPSSPPTRRPIIPALSLNIHTHGENRQQKPYSGSISTQTPRLHLFIVLLSRTISVPFKTDRLVIHTYVQRPAIAMVITKLLWHIFSPHSSI